MVTGVVVAMLLPAAAMIPATNTGSQSEPTMLYGNVLGSASLVDNFDYWPGCEIDGLVGPVGTWSATEESGFSCKVFDDSGDTVLQQIDTTGTDAVSELSFTHVLAVGYSNSITWTQCITSPSNAWIEEFLQYGDGSGGSVYLHFGDSVVSYLPGDGPMSSVPDPDNPGHAMACTTDAGETYEVRFTNPGFFQMRKNGGTWTGSLQSHAAFTGTSPSVALMRQGGTGDAAYSVNVDDIAWNHVPLVENFEGYTLGTSIDGLVSPMGSWVGIVEGANTCKVDGDGWNKVYRQVDSSTTASVRSKLIFSLPGSVSSGNTVAWQQKIAAESTWWSESFWQYTGYTGGSVALLFESSSSTGYVKYYQGSTAKTISDPDNPGNLLMFSKGSWESYEVRFVSAYKFQIRKNGGSWSAELSNRFVFTGTSPTVAMMHHGGCGAATYDVMLDDIVGTW